MDPGGAVLAQFRGWMFGEFGGAGPAPRPGCRQTAVAGQNLPVGVQALDSQQRLTLPVGAGRRLVGDIAQVLLQIGRGHLGEAGGATVRQPGGEHVEVLDVFAQRLDAGRVAAGVGQARHVLNNVDHREDVELAGVPERLREAAPVDARAGGVAVGQRGGKVPAGIAEAGQRTEVGVGVKLSPLQDRCVGSGEKVANPVGRRSGIGRGGFGHSGSRSPDSRRATRCRWSSVISARACLRCAGSYSLMTSSS